MQLTPLDMDYQCKEQAKTQARLDEVKKPRVIPREKSSPQFSFKYAAFNLLPPTQSVLTYPKSIYFPSSAPKDTHLGFEMFIGRNPFDLRTNPSTFSYFLLSSSFSSSFPHTLSPIVGRKSLPRILLFVTKPAGNPNLPLVAKPVESNLQVTILAVFVLKNLDPLSEICLLF